MSEFDPALVYGRNVMTSETLSLQDAKARVYADMAAFMPAESLKRTQWYTWDLGGGVLEVVARYPGKGSQITLGNDKAAWWTPEELEASC